MVGEAVFRVQQAVEGSILNRETCGVTCLQLSHVCNKPVTLERNIGGHSVQSMVTIHLSAPQAP